MDLAQDCRWERRCLSRGLQRFAHRYPGNRKVPHVVTHLNDVITPKSLGVRTSSAPENCVPRGCSGAGVHAHTHPHITFSTTVEMT